MKRNATYASKMKLDRHILEMFLHPPKCSEFIFLKPCILITFANSLSPDQAQKNVYRSYGIPKRIHKKISRRQDA